MSKPVLKRANTSVYASSTTALASPEPRQQGAQSYFELSPRGSPAAKRKIPPFGTKDFQGLLNQDTPKSIGDKKLAKRFGDDVIVYSSSSADVRKSPKPEALPEPGGDAMALAYKFCGAGNVRLISSHKSPHLLEYHPRSIVNIEHSDRLTENMKGNSAFFLNTSPEELQQNAGNIPRSACVVVSNNSMKSVAKQVMLLNHIRPDLGVYGHASTFEDLQNKKGAIEAFRRVGAILGGEKAVVVRPLKERDSRWIEKTTNFYVPTGTAIPALFDNAGNLDHKWFQNEYESNKDSTNTVKTFANIHNALNLSSVLSSVPKGKFGVRKMHAVQKLLHLPKVVLNRQDQLKKLGKVLLLGSTGNVGDGILRALSGRVEIDAPVRDIHKAPAAYLGNVKHPVRQLPLKDYSKDGHTADTVFIAASAPRDTSKTDRAGQLLANLEGVMIPLMAKIPSSVKLVQIITNPCADMTYAAWLLRPDLSEKLASHSGTDIVRQQEHVAHPNDPNTYFTFGPHSPNQSNVDLVSKVIDPSIANKASDINKRSGGQATTDPTSLSSIYEAVNIIDRKQSSYAFPLTEKEAEKLQKFLRESGAEDLKDIDVHEGLAPTLPRKNGQINWKMLEQARKHVSDFLANTAPAMAELVSGRDTILNHVVAKVKEKRPDLAGQVDQAWVVGNRAGLLGILNQS